MVRPSKAKQLQALERLRDAVPAISGLDANSPQFRVWYKATLRMLRVVLGESDPIVAQIRAIQFEANSPIKDAADLSARLFKESDPNSNLTRIRPHSIQTANVQDQYFRRAVSEVGDLIVAAIAQANKLPN